MIKLDWRSVSVLALMGCSVAACAPPDPSGPTSEEGAKGRDDAIKGGAEAVGYPEAVLVDLYQDGQLTAACSGAVIAPNVVMTAGHCVQGSNGWTVRAPFANGQTAVAASAMVYDWTTTAETVDPTMHDIGLVFLATPITLANYPSIASSHVAFGSDVQDMGRIDNGVLSTTALYLGPAVSVSDGATVGYPFSYASSDIIESGDSGGPVVVPGTHQIVAVNSGAGGNLQVLARVDFLASWIDQQIASHASTPNPDTTPTPPNPTPDPTPPADPCGGITYAGDCSGNTVEWCENNQVQHIDCASQNLTCGFDSTNQFYNCL